MIHIGKRGTVPFQEQAEPEKVDPNDASTFRCFLSDQLFELLIWIIVIP
jgi:hypothetical protein